MKQLTFLITPLVLLTLFSGCENTAAVNGESQKNEERPNSPVAVSFPSDDEDLFRIYRVNTNMVVDTKQLVWNDEFSGNTLDASKWSPAPNWQRQGLSYWSDNNYKMTGNGQVKLQVTEENGKVYAGAIRTHNKFDQKYGYFEVRCKLPEIHGGWAAFWLMPYGNKPGSWGDDGTEMDVFESINGWNGKINHALHWDGYGAEHQKASQSTSRPDLYDGQYHTFSMLWTPEEYVFYIDNVESWRTSAGGVADVNQYLKLTLEVSSDSWAGNWNNQVTKPIDWLIDYVRVYDYKSVPNNNNPLSLSFETLSSGVTVSVGDPVEMDVLLSGNVSNVDELQFLVKKGNGEFVLEKSVAIGSQQIYKHTWIPSQPGSYALRINANKGGSYVTHLVANLNVETSLEPFSLSFNNLNSGLTFSKGESLSMDVDLSGDLSAVDELQFLTKNGDGEFIEQATATVSNVSSYAHNWVANQAGNYALRVTAKKNNSYVTHIVVNDVTIEEMIEPLKLAYTVLGANQTFNVGDPIKMHTKLSGDVTSIDQLKFILQKSGETSSVLKKSTVTPSELVYWNKWIPTETGSYKLKVTAYSQGAYVTHIKEWINVVDMLTINYRLLQGGQTYSIGDEVKMHVDVLGDFSQADEIKFVIQKSGNSDTVIKSSSLVSTTSTYYKKWIPSESGSYKLKVQAFKDGAFLRHTVVDVIVQ
jgi:beta-glucanase (GH16 family)